MDDQQNKYTKVTNTASPSVTVARLELAVKWAVMAAIVLTVGLVGWFTWGLPQIAASDAAIRSILVQPFIVAGNDSLSGGIAKGLTADITTALKQIPGISVAPNRSAVPTGGMSTSAGPNSPSVQPNLLLTGAVTRDGDHIGVSITLTNIRQGYAVWTRSTDHIVQSDRVLPSGYAQAIAQQIQQALMK